MSKVSPEQLIGSVDPPPNETLSSPTNLVAKTRGSGVLLSWDNVDSATEYKIYYGTNTGVNTSDNSGRFPRIWTVLPGKIPREIF